MMEVISQEQILGAIPKRRGRKPKLDTETKVWSDPEYRKQYYKTYYETKRPKDYIVCECGTQCKRGYLYIHQLTKHHKQYIEMKDQLVKQYQTDIPLNNTCK